MAALVLLLSALSGCALMARDHACYAYLAHQYQGHVPGSVVRELAGERGTRRQVGAMRAPAGLYWRRQRAATLDLNDIRTRLGDYELARCPGLMPAAGTPAGPLVLPPPP
jgi:hypothetical protein